MGSWGAGRIVRQAVAVSAFASMGFTLGGCVADTDQDRDVTSSAGATSQAATARSGISDHWERHSLRGAMEKRPWKPLQELAAMADVVALGHVSGVVGNENRGGAWATVYLFTVDEAFTGATPGEVLYVDFISPGFDQDGADAFVEHAREAITDEPILALLTGPGEDGAYWAINSRSWWVATSRAVLDSPLTEDPTDDPMYRDDLAAADGSVEKLAQIAARGLAQGR